MERGPVSLTIGEQQVISGFENALPGMEEGETKTDTIESYQAYGSHDPNLVHIVDRTRLPLDVKLTVGAAAQATTANGAQMRLTVTDLDDENVTLDVNYPLAGRALNFEMTLASFVA